MAERVAALDAINMEISLAIAEFGPTTGLLLTEKIFARHDAPHLRDTAPSGG